MTVPCPCHIVDIYSKSSHKVKPVNWRRNPLTIIEWILHEASLNWQTRIKCSSFKLNQHFSVDGRSFRKYQNLFTISGTLTNGFYCFCSWYRIFAFNIYRITEWDQIYHITWVKFILVFESHTLHKDDVWFLHLPQKQVRLITGQPTCRIQKNVVIEV